ncbi:MAG: hypothetical protein WKF59_21920 [Chitinophagaceae bacterium]
MSEEENITQPTDDNPPSTENKTVAEETQPQTLNPHPSTSDMEVHHHLLHVHEKKKMERICFSSSSCCFCCVLRIF